MTTPLRTLAAVLVMFALTWPACAAQPSLLAVEEQAPAAPEDPLATAKQITADLTARMRAFRVEMSRSLLWNFSLYNRDRLARQYTALREQCLAQARAEIELIKRNARTEPGAVREHLQRARALVAPDAADDAELARQLDGLKIIDP